MKLHTVVNILLSIIVLAGAVLGGRWMMQNKRQPALRVPEKVIPKVVAPAIEPLRNEHVRIIGYGSARPRIQVKITPQVSGTVVEKSPNFLSGKYVSKGEVLCRIEQIDYELAVERVEKQIELLRTQLARVSQEEQNLKESARIERQRLELAENQVEKVTRLVERNAASDNELDQMKETLLAREVQLQNILNQLALIGPQRAQLEAETGSAEVELKQAETNLSRCVISSPVMGKTLGCDIEVGEQAAAGMMWGEIYGTDIMELPVSMAYSELEWIGKDILAAGGEIEAIVEWEQPGSEQTISWRGYIDRIEAGLEAQTRTAGLVVQVNNPRPNEGRAMLEVNMFCKVTVLGKKLPEVYILPRQAIQPDNSVYVVVGGKLDKRKVQVARFAGEEAMILPGGGLSEGERVVLNTISKPVIGMAAEAVGE